MKVSQDFGMRRERLGRQRESRPGGREAQSHVVNTVTEIPYGVKTRLAETSTDPPDARSAAVCSCPDALVHGL